MNASPITAELEGLIRLQRELEDRVNALPIATDEILDVGAAVLAFAEWEQRAFFPLLPLLDPAARAELGDEHDQIAEDLQLLEWLHATTPESTDIEALGASLVRRMRDHIARDGRLLTQAVRLAGRNAADTCSPET